MEVRRPERSQKGLDCRVRSRSFLHLFLGMSRAWMWLWVSHSGRLDLSRVQKPGPDGAEIFHFTKKEVFLHTRLGPAPAPWLLDTV